MQLSRNSKISFAAFVVFDLLLAYWLITLFQARDEVETVNALNALGAIEYPEPYRLTPFQLSDQIGDPFLVDDFAGQWSLVFFGFTSCPDVCPITCRSWLRLTGRSRRCRICLTRKWCSFQWIRSATAGRL